MLALSLTLGLVAPNSIGVREDIPANIFDTLYESLPRQRMSGTDC